MNMGKIRKNVGVAVGNIKMGVRKIMPPPLVAVAEGAAVAMVVFVGAAVGIMAVGGATIDASVSGIQSAEVTDPAIHAKPPSPPANSMYHHVPS